jgi:hypothetical protein
LFYKQPTAILKLASTGLVFNKMAQLLPKTNMDAPEDCMVNLNKNSSISVQMCIKRLVPVICYAKVLSSENFYGTEKYYL